ncbi:MAG: molybdenum cofactor guanylyltransferase [Polyangiaceae bacterium]|nr:molybdenum cofactor guanylyltransferase [Polyangiaceae bacterium]
MTRQSVAGQAARRADTALGAVLLVGGGSSRMGRDKALIEIDGEALVRRAAHVLGAVAGAGVVVVAATAQQLPDLGPGVQVVRDAARLQGPLAALAQGVRALPPSATRFVACATDLPRLHASVARRLVELLAQHDAAVPEIAGYPQPLAAAYARRAGAVAESPVAEGERSMRALVSRLDARVVTPAELLADGDVVASDPQLSSFLDVDTPEELAALLGRPH